MSTRDDVTDEAQAAPEVAAVTGRQRKPKPAAASAPLTIIGFTVAAADWRPPKRLPTSWMCPVPALYYALPDALAPYGGDLTQLGPGVAPKRAYKVTVTFEPVEDGGAS